MANIGVIGLGVMGENIILNFESRGYKVCVFNRTKSKVDEFVNKNKNCKGLIPTYTLEEFVGKLAKPRVVLMIVMAGSPVTTIIDELMRVLEQNDIIIDGGNSDYNDTEKRWSYVESKGFRYIGMGVSGGESGARYGPSLMPGGSKPAWEIVEPMLKKISAKVNNDKEECVSWMGSGGAGHYVKMVHNGIEYGDMQVICEAYHIMKYIFNMPSNEISEIFKEWNKGTLQSYLIEITSSVLSYKENGSFLVDQIRDTAGQKGTGKWTVVNGLEMGIPITLIGEAVFSRCLSAIKDERVKCSKYFKNPPIKCDFDKKTFIEDIRNALYASKLVSYSQGFMLLREASKKYNWKLKLGEIAMVWRAGCIIRSKFLSNIYDAFQKDPDLESLLINDYFKTQIETCIDSWRRVVSTCVMNGVPVPAMSSALSFFDGYRCAKLPANLLQAQRDYFGAHTYELESEPGKFHHSSWGAQQ